jgi:DMSO/TMAO reductase YedYZ molybdopterin-dependent catalytic subunit
MSEETILSAGSSPVLRHPSKGDTYMSKLPQSITRRQFVRLALTGSVTALVEAACRGPAGPVPAAVTPTATPAPSATTQATATATPVPSATAEAIATPTPVPSPTPEPVATLPPLPQNTPPILRNRNDPNYNVRYYKPLEPVDRGEWQLRVSGLVETRGNFSLEELLGWPQVEQVSRMKCVECWSYKAKWGGFQYESLAEQVQPKPEATHLRFDCADDYWEIVSIEELADPRVIFVLMMNDDLLLDEYGAPLRMMFPAKYGYKSAKAITAITFSAQDGPGYWSTVGPYTGHGDIQAGFDFPQDHPGERMNIDGGEITAY